MKATQSIPNGTKVRFNLNGLTTEELEMFANEIASGEEGEIGVIEYLDSYTELGNKNFEYYTIRFNDNSILDGVSGYHLDIIEAN